MTSINQIHSLVGVRLIYKPVPGRHGVLCHGNPAMLTAESTRALVEAASGLLL